jgi:hypothetical protein
MKKYFKVSGLHTEKNNFWKARVYMSLDDMGLAFFKYSPKKLLFTYKIVNPELFLLSKLKYSF